MHACTTDICANMRKGSLLTLIVITITACLTGIKSGFAQTDTLAPMVLSASGNSSTIGGFNLAYTVGEPVITTDVYPNPASPQIYLTQGFHQPVVAGAFNFNLSFTSESCMGSNDGSAAIQINGGAAPYTVVWSSNPSLSGNTIDSLKPGTYTVSVTDAHGKTKSMAFNILASNNNCLIKIYNGITPNGDGHNDTWVIDNIEEYPDNSVSIYNRWGSEVWKANSYNNTSVVWNGNNLQGQPLPDGTYFYIVQVSGVSYKGWVQLTR